MHMVGQCDRICCLVISWISFVLCHETICLQKLTHRPGKQTSTRDRDTLGNFGFRWGLGIRIPSSVCWESTSTCVNKQFAIFVKQVSIEHRTRVMTIPLSPLKSCSRVKL